MRVREDDAKERGVFLVEPRDRREFNLGRVLGIQRRTEVENESFAL